MQNFITVVSYLQVNTALPPNTLNCACATSITETVALAGYVFFERTKFLDYFILHITHLHTDNKCKNISNCFILNIYVIKLHPQYRQPLPALLLFS